VIDRDRFLKVRKSPERLEKSGRYLDRLEQSRYIDSSVNKQSDEFDVERIIANANTQRE